MIKTIRVLLAAASFGAIAFGAFLPAHAQYNYPPPGYPPPDYDAAPPDPGYGPPPPNQGYGPPPDQGYGPPPPAYGYRYGYRTFNGCPPGYTVQGGVCQPYRGPVGGGWNTFNGCPPGFTVQGGACAPQVLGESQKSESASG